MTDVYYQLNDGTNTLTFVLSAIDVSKEREIWNMSFPYVKLPSLTDQITTVQEIVLNCKIKPGTGFPYATVKTAITAIDNLTGEDYSSGWTLKGGDWDGTTWTENTDYPHAWGSGDDKLLVKSPRYNQKAGDSYATGEITVVINVLFGTVY